MLTKRRLEKWLIANGFQPVPRGASGHAYFKHAGSGVKVTIAKHGSSDVPRKHQSLLLRSLEEAGFEREATRKELERL